MAATLYRDDPWRRVPWLLPTAAALTALSLMGFLKLLAGPPPLVTALAPAVEVDVVEVAPSLPTPPARSIASNPPPLALEPPTPSPVPQPAPPPTPAPPVAQTLPPPPIATEPEPVLVPDTRPPPPPPVARTKPPATPAQRAALPQRTAPPAPPAAPSPPTAVAPTPPTPAPAPAVASVPPNGGSMGARAIYQPLPEVPETLRHRAIELVAVARFHVAVDGSAEVELTQPTPDATLNRALLETLKKWRFFPAMDGGEPEASTIDIRIPISVH